MQHQEHVAVALREKQQHLEQYVIAHHLHAISLLCTTLQRHENRLLAQEQALLKSKHDQDMLLAKLTDAAM